MSKYIDAEAFFKVINTLPYKDTSYPDASAYNGAISDVADMLTHFPAADVRPVVREKWIIHKPFDSGRHNCNECIECSACGTWFGHDCYALSNFCPNCGALMVNEDE